MKQSDAAAKPLLAPLLKRGVFGVIKTVLPEIAAVTFDDGQEAELRSWYSADVVAALAHLAGELKGTGEAGFKSAAPKERYAEASNLAAATEAVLAAMDELSFGNLITAGQLVGGPEGGELFRQHLEAVAEWSRSRATDLKPPHRRGRGEVVQSKRFVVGVVFRLVRGQGVKFSQDPSSPFFRTCDIVFEAAGLKGCAGAIKAAANGHKSAKTLP